MTPFVLCLLFTRSSFVHLLLSPILKEELVPERPATLSSSAPSGPPPSHETMETGRIYGSEQMCVRGPVVWGGLHWRHFFVSPNTNLTNTEARVPEEPRWAPLTEEPSVQQRHQGPSNPQTPPCPGPEGAFMAGVLSLHVSKRWQTFLRSHWRTGAHSPAGTTPLGTTCGRD